jgi:hypothetical protein
MTSIVKMWHQIQQDTNLLIKCLNYFTNNEQLYYIPALNFKHFTL